MAIGDEYQCALCGGVFTTTVSEDDAEAEYAAVFPDDVDEPGAVVCDDCWRKMGFGS